MKQVLLILFLLCGIVLSSFIGVNGQIKKSDFKSPLSFAGYQDSSPVFDADKEKKIYLYKDNELIFIKEYDNKRFLIFVQNDLYLYHIENEEGNWIIVVKKEKETKYKVNSSGAYFASNGHDIYYTDITTGRIKVITIEGEKDFGVAGYVSGYSQGCLYYAVGHDPNLIYANVDVFRIDVQQPPTPEKIMTNVAGEATYILPDNKYIFEQILHEGEFKPVIYNIEKKKYKILKLDKKFSDGSPYYSHQTGQLVFYRSQPLEMLNIPIPTEFDLIR